MLAVMTKLTVKYGKTEMSSSKSILSLVERAQALLDELNVEYEQCIQTKKVTDKACNITHEIIEKCSNALDQIMYQAWKQRIEKKLTNPPKRTGYFPAANDTESYKSSLGQWGTSDLAGFDENFENLLASYQPFNDPKNIWVSQLKDLARSKHTGLIPQKQVVEDQRTVVSVKSGSGFVSWGNGVSFGSGVSMFGVPINPSTQLPVPSQELTVKREQWIGFHLEGTSLNASAFCDKAIKGTKEIVEHFISDLALT